MFSLSLSSIFSYITLYEPYNPDESNVVDKINTYENLKTFSFLFFCLKVYYYYYYYLYYYYGTVISYIKVYRVIIASICVTLDHKTSQKGMFLFI